MSDPTVKREVDYFKANIKNVTTSKQFVNDNRLFTFAMTAFGLKDMAYAKSFMQKIIDGGVSDARSLANSLTDSRFKAFVKSFDFGDLGVIATSFDANNNAVVTNYIAQTMEDKVGQSNSATQLALYFQRQAPNITNAYQILGDKALFQFVQTAYNIPTFSGQTSAAVAAEAALVGRKINIADLRDPVKVQQIMTRFAAMSDAITGDASASSPALTVLTSYSSGSSISDKVVQSIQSRYFQY